MRYKLVDTDKFGSKISELLVDSEDPENPNPENNAYNWGLVHAQMLLNGVPMKAIRDALPL
jgi:hypothetical protein